MLIKFLRHSGFGEFDKQNSGNYANKYKKIIRLNLGHWDFQIMHIILDIIDYLPSAVTPNFTWTPFVHPGIFRASFNLFKMYVRPENKIKKNLRSQKLEFVFRVRIYLEQVETCTRNSKIFTMNVNIHGFTEASSKL